MRAPGRSSIAALWLLVTGLGCDRPNPAYVARVPAGGASGTGGSDGSGAPTTDGARITETPMSGRIDASPDVPTILDAPPSDLPAGMSTGIDAVATPASDGGLFADTPPNGRIDASPDVPTILDAPRSGLAAGMIGYWRFDDPSGSAIAADSSGQGNHGTLLRMDVNSAWTPGRVKGALRFNGVDQWVTIPSSDSLNSPSITKSLSVSIWINRADSTKSTQGFIGRQYKTTVFEHFLLFTSDNKFTADVNNSAATLNWCIGPQVPPGVWTHVAATTDGRVIYGYLNGVRVCQTDLGANSTFSADNTPVTIAANIDRPAAPSDQCFAGLIDEVVMYNRVLSPAEIGDLAAGKSPLVP